MKKKIVDKKIIATVHGEKYKGIKQEATGMKIP
jgi:hypothetical protein